VFFGLCWVPWDSLSLVLDVWNWVSIFFISLWILY
jgi:hypothetical protein